MKHPVEIPPPEGCGHCQVDHDLEAALRLQRLLAEISSRFATRPAGQMGETIDETLKLICARLGLDRATLWLTGESGTEMALTHYWQRPDAVPLRRNYVTSGNFPWSHGMVRRGEPFHSSCVEDLPPEAAEDLKVLRQYGTKSNAIFPLSSDGKVFGALAFASLTVERHWSDTELSSLKLLAQIFGHVICRHRAEERVEQLLGEIQRSARASELGEIAAALAHEINQPLTTILSNAQAARRFIRQGEASPEELLAILDDIIRDNKRADGVIRNLRAMLTDAPVTREPYSLNELVSEVAAFLDKEITDAGMELRLDLAPASPRIRVARPEIQQLLHNLIQNATHAMQDTPVENRWILVQTSSSGQSATVRVTDHGCGVSPEHMDRIFEPFHTTRKNGLGMGLAICRRIVEAHGGGIAARNTAAGGAEFSFSLPVC